MENKETLTLSGIMHQIDLSGIYRPYNMQATEYNFCASTHGILSRIDHISGQKQNINKCKKTNGIFSGHNATGIEIN